MNTTSFRFPAFLLTALVALPLIAQEPGGAGETVRRDALRRAGVGASLALWPVRVLGRANADVADALGLVLERQGMPSLTAVANTFDARELAWEAIPAAFGAHVATGPGKGLVPAAGYALYAEFLGDPKQGPTEVRFVVVDAKGGTVLSDRQSPGDATFRRTAGADPDPLGCATCVGERLFELAGWSKVPGGVRDGRFGALWQKKSGAPDRKERAAMQQRAATLRSSLAEATVAVFAPLWPAATDVDAARFAAAVGAGLACKAATPVAVTVAVAPSPNQQKRLYDLAAVVKAQLQKQPIEADYAVAVDLGFAEGGQAGYANVVVLDRAGELVLAEFQNDQHPLFRQQAPKSLADGEKLAVAMLTRVLR